MDRTRTGPEGPRTGLQGRPFAPLTGALLAGALLAACGGGDEPTGAAGLEPAAEAAAPSSELADPFPGPPVAERPEPDLPKVQDLPRSHRELHAMLISDEVLMEWKLEILQDELAPDPSSAATQVLILATLNESTQVSMASLKALSERADEPDVSAHLLWMLDDERWERRAWAARVLGTDGSDEMVPVLQARLERESETRVRRQLEAAIENLRSQTAEVLPKPGEAGG